MTAPPDILTDALVDALLQELARDDASTALANMTAVLARHGIHASSAAITASDRGTRLVAALFAVAHARVAAEDAHARTRERMEMLSTAAFEGVFVHVDNAIIDANERVAEMLGYTRAELLGRETFRRCVAPEDQAATIARVAGGVEGDYVITAIRKDGTRFRAELQAKQGTLGERPVRLVAVRDVTERERLAQQAEQSQRLESLGVLAGGIAHDFNNLLVGIQGNAEDLLERIEAGGDGEAVQALQAILLAAQRAAALTAQMLAYAGQRETRRPVPVDLLDLVGELRTLLGASLSKKARVDFVVPRGLRVLGDRTTLSQVLMNLLTNASDALADAVGVIRVDARHVGQPDARWRHALGAPIEAGAAPFGWIQLSVTDSGEGMDAARQARIFEPFFTTKKTGHGLGLAASVGIVRTHGGAIHVESEPGRGTTVSVLLPASDAETTIQPEAAAIAPVATRTEHARRLLVIDDEHHIRGFLTRLLGRHGYRVTAAERGDEALELARREPFDVVMLDLTMPDLSGLQVLERLRASGATMPVILSSGHLNVDIEAGRFQGYLQKPYRVTELLEVIERALATPVVTQRADVEPGDITPA